MDPKGDLYFDAAGTRYFVIPRGTTPAPGSLELLSLDGLQLHVEPGAVEAYRIEVAEADALIEANATNVVETATDAVVARLAPVLAAAPGLDSVMSPDTYEEGGSDANVVLGKMLGIDAEEAKRDPSRITAGLDGLLDALAQAAGHPKGTMGGPSQSMDEVLEKVTALAANMQRLPAGGKAARDASGPWQAFMDAVQKIANPKPEDPQEGYRKAAKESVDRAFKDFKLPSFKYEDLVKPPPPKETPVDDSTND